MRQQDRLQGWLKERFPQHPYHYFGVSGTTLLFEALNLEQRTSMVLPAFICPSLSAMAMWAGKTVTHIDADPETMLPKLSTLDAYLWTQAASECVLLIDHSFGYPFAAMEELRRRFPELLIVEDCVRALGVSIGGTFPGEHADWILLSMYKTITGPRNGAVLLSRKPLGLQPYPQARVTIRERAATIAPLRFFYDLAQRQRRWSTGPPGGLKAPVWTPEYGSPSELCLSRFVAEIERVEQRRSERDSIAEELFENLGAIKTVERVPTAEGSTTAGHFVSFRMRTRQDRDSLLASLQRSGLFLSRTWERLPLNYEIFAKTFPAGSAGSRELQERIVHIPTRLFAGVKERRRLIQALRSRVPA
jgi:dTDP-4-amino-4,6-dideoxygalactose transaminase